jgi:hypothetical protein
VLARLGGGHVHDLARAVLDHNVAVLAESRALHGVRGRRAGVSRLEGVFMGLVTTRLASNASRAGTLAPQAKPGGEAGEQRSCRGTCAHVPSTVGLARKCGVLFFLPKRTIIHEQQPGRTHRVVRHLEETGKEYCV